LCSFILRINKVVSYSLAKIKTVSGRQPPHLFFLLSQQCTGLSRKLQNSKGEEIEEAFTAAS
jgi:hypothetical protein